jgi:hypothetical protein
MTAATAVKDKPESKDRPGSANEALAAVNENHTWVKEPEDLTTSPGLQRAVQENRDAIQALADYIDKK